MGVITRPTLSIIPKPTLNKIVRPILKDISILAEVGERIAVIGENGIGKTTFLRTLLNEVGYEASSGEFTWSENSSIGYYAQDHEYEFENDMTLFEWMSQWSAYRRRTSGSRLPRSIIIFS